MTIKVDNAWAEHMVPFEGQSPKQAIDELSDAISFEATDHDVVLRGTCERCS